MCVHVYVYVYVHKCTCICTYMCMCVCTHTYTHTVDYYSSIKKKVITSFAGAWMDLEIIMLSEVSQRQISYITYMWNLKYDINELIYETKTDSQI